jgi:hypothetical protein
MTLTTTEQKIAIMQAYLDGKTIEYRHKNIPEDRDFLSFDRTDDESPIWEWGLFDYRIKQSTPDNINWDHVHPDYNYMARDNDGLVYLYGKKPTRGSPHYGMWSTNENQEGKVSGAQAFASFKQGEVDWKDSLVVRPGYEVRMAC